MTVSENFFEEVLEDVPVDESEVLPSDPAEGLPELAWTEDTDDTVSSNNVSAESVSSGDLSSDIFYSSVSSGNGSLIVDNAELSSKLDVLHIDLVVIVFLILFVWVESRIRALVWRFFANGKSN